MKIGSFNINGVKARLPALLDWLRDAATDVVVLQEIKCTDDQFPRLEIEEMGYNIETHGQKGFNGVAILSRLPLSDVRRGLPGDDGDEQSRWIEAEVAGIRIGGLYLPNGNPAPGPKYDYKLAWMARLEARATLVRERVTPDVEVSGLLVGTPVTLAGRVKDELRTVVAPQLLQAGREPRDLESWVFAVASITLLFLAAGFHGATRAPAG